MRIFKFLSFFVIVLSVLTCNAQDFSKSWNQYFSYLNISYITQSENFVYASAENAIFKYNKLTQEVETISSVQSLSGDNISTIYYVEAKALLFIGYDTGLVQVYNELSSDMLNVVDIINKPSIISDRKKINSFSEFEDIVYISTDFGLLEYDVVNLEFGDTFFIGTNNTQIKINEVAVFEDFIYAASETGLKRASVTNPNLIDSQQWQSITGLHWTQIDKVGSKLYGATTTRRVYEIVGGTGIMQKEIFPIQILDLSSYNSMLAITTVQSTKIYTEDYSQISIFLASDYNATKFTKGSVFNDDVYIGTTGTLSAGKEGYGILKSNINNFTEFEEIHPQCPILNRIFQIDISGDNIWAVHGSYDRLYGYALAIPRTGISIKKGGNWQNLTFDNLNNQLVNPYYLNHVTLNKFNPNKYYISSYYRGFLEFNNDIIETLYDEDNSTLEIFSGPIYLVQASTYDRNNDLWVINARVDRALNVLRQNGQWESFDLSEVILNAGANNGFSDIAFDATGNLFIGSARNGLLSYNFATGLVTNLVGDENNMPSNDVRAVSVDKNNHVWVGSKEGLRIIYNPDEYANGNPTVESIIFSEDGVGSELFFQQFVNDIEVDGTNNKWIGTIGNGVFLVSPDGQETLYHFTKDNSPLPSNEILDVKINETTGEVFFATETGMVSFKGTSSEPQENLENAYVYPNPVRPGFNFDRDKIKITGLSKNVNIKIVDIEGNLVIEAESKSNGKFNGFNLEVDGGTALWNGRNLANKIVASGVYVVLLNDLETFETKVLKVMIVR